MRKSRYSETEILKILQCQEQGQRVQEICREYGISHGTFHRWKSKYSGLAASDIKKMKELESENARLKRMYAERSMEVEALKDVLSKKW